MRSPSIPAPNSEETRALMNSTKRDLQEIRVRGSGNGEYGDSDAQTIKDIIAAGTKNGEILQYTSLYVPPSLGAFEMFIDENKSTLRSVYIPKDRNHLISQEDAGKWIGTFLKCPNLQQIGLRAVPAKSVLETLRCRGIH